MGLPQGEGMERVVAAIQNSGFLVPPKRITINLSPARGSKENTKIQEKPLCFSSKPYG